MNRVEIKNGASTEKTTKYRDAVNTGNTTKYRETSLETVVACAFLHFVLFSVFGCVS